MENNERVVPENHENKLKSFQQDSLTLNSQDNSASACYFPWTLQLCDLQRLSVSNVMEERDIAGDETKKGCILTDWNYLKRRRKLILGCVECTWK